MDNFRCGKSSGTCREKFYCDTVISRCVPCAVLCDPPRGTTAECCSHCKKLSQQLNFQCPEIQPTTVSTARTSSTTPSTSLRPRRTNKNHSNKKKNRNEKRKKSSRQKTSHTPTATKFGLTSSSMVPKFLLTSTNSPEPLATSPALEKVVPAVTTVMSPGAALLAGSKFYLIGGLLVFIVVLVLIFVLLAFILCKLRTRKAKQEQTDICPQQLEGLVKKPCPGNPPPSNDYLLYGINLQPEVNQMGNVLATLALLDENQLKSQIVDYTTRQHDTKHLQVHGNNAQKAMVDQAKDVPENCSRLGKGEGVPQ